MDPARNWKTWPAADKARLRWRLLARDKQREPVDPWAVWLILAGRGWGKTRTGAEWAREQATSGPPTRGAIVAPTYADARDTCVEGPSGLLQVVPKSLIRVWNRSLGELEFHNGSHIKLFSADTPERLRGPNHHWAWGDELCAWRYMETWDQLMFGLRLGVAKTVVTTTPKPLPIIKELLERDDCSFTTGHTFENEKNLAATALDQLRRKYEGTRLGRQELYAEILEDLEGALWQRPVIEGLRVRTVPEMRRVVVAVDPAVTHSDTSNETGIVVAGLGVDDHAYVLADRTIKASPDTWAKRVVAAFEEFEADRVLAEVNHGYDLIETILRSSYPNLSYRPVKAKKGKRLRAEPVAALYEQGRVHHLGAFPELEDQMCNFVDTETYQGSPDRLDAMVYAITDLCLSGKHVDKLVSPAGIASPSHWRVA